MSYNTLWTIPDDLWRQVRRVLPPDKPRGAPGRPALPNRQVLNGILSVLRTGCHGKALKTEWFGASRCIRTRYQTWVEVGVFDRLFRLLLLFYDQRRRIQWRWQVIDSQSVAAPLGGEKTGKNPTDRGKYGRRAATRSSVSWRDGGVITQRSAHTPTFTRGRTVLPVPVRAA